MTESIEEQIRKFIAENLIYANSYPHDDETSFLESGIVDSMNVMEIVMFAEQRYAIKVKDEEIIPANFDSVRNLAAYIRSHTATA